MTGMQNDKKKNKIDWIMIFIIIILVGFGLLMIYSASSYQGQTEKGSALWYVVNQIKAVAVGAAAMAVVAIIPYNIWNSILSYAVFGICTIAVLLVLSPLGIEIYGARRWLDLKVTTVQPSEFLKVALILCMAYILYKKKDSLNTVKDFALAMIPTFAAVLMVVVITEDLGTAMIIFGMGVVLAAIAVPEKKYIGGMILLLILFGVIFILLKGNRIVRIKAWLNVEAYANDESYQIMQAFYAIASGGWLGKGLGNGTQKLGYVPESENDMIFSIICEELGVVGGLCLLLLIGMLIWRMWLLYRDTEDMFGKLIVAGVMSHISIQTFVNVGVVSGLLPNTGVPLPFISYGGTSIMMTLIEMGLVVSVARGARYIKKKSPKTAREYEQTLKEHYAGGRREGITH